MTALGFRYALREPMRFALTACGLACAAVLTVFLAAVYRGVLRGSLRYIEDADAQVWVGKKGSWNLMRASGLLSGAQQEAVMAVPGVRDAEPILTALLPAQVGGHRRTLLVVGLDDGADPARPRHVLEGRALPGPGEIVVDAAFARRVGIALGDELDVAERRARVVGITADTNLLVTQYAFASRADLLEAVGVADRATFLLVRADRSGARALAASIEAAVDGVSAFDRDTFLANNRREIEAGFLPVLWAIAVLGVVVGGAVVALMTYAAVLEKRADYVLLAALGAGGGARLAVVLQQALLAALAGGALGLGALLAIERALPALVPEVQLQLDPWLAAAALAGALLMAALGATVPGRIATSLPPLEALRR